jgi:hypothetical protein
MPSGKNWVSFLYINIIFILYFIAVFYLNQVTEIKKNWPMYRCNPVYMPLADDINTNFAYCIQTMQSDFMSYLLQPVTFLTSVLGDTLGGMVGQINDVRGMFSNIRTFLPDFFTNIFGSFSNLTIELQKVTIGIKDLMGKTSGIMSTIMYIMDTSITTMKTGNNLVSGNKCFHPNTKIKLKNGKIKAMKDLDLGDILINGSVVECVMKINNKNNYIPFYVINNAGVNDEDIYVTGSHFIYDIQSSKYIKVENYKNAKLSNVKCDWFSCLITNDHTITIGKNTFWDWEDYLIRMKID